MTDNTFPMPSIARMRQAVINDEPIGWAELKRWMGFLLDSPVTTTVKLLADLQDEREIYTPVEDDFDKGYVRAINKFIKKIENGEYDDHSAQEDNRRILSEENNRYSQQCRFLENELVQAEQERDELLNIQQLWKEINPSVYGMFQLIATLNQDKAVLLEGLQMFLAAHKARGAVLTAACGDQAAVKNAYGLITQYTTGCGRPNLDHQQHTSQ